jgi:hypothetical protein
MQVPTGRLTVCGISPTGATPLGPPPLVRLDGARSAAHRFPSAALPANRRNGPASERLARGFPERARLAREALRRTRVREVQRSVAGRILPPLGRRRSGRTLSRAQVRAHGSRLVPMRRAGRCDGAPSRPRLYSSRARTSRSCSQRATSTSLHGRSRTLNLASGGAPPRYRCAPPGRLGAVTFRPRTLRTSPPWCSSRQTLSSRSFGEAISTTRPGPLANLVPRQRGLGSAGPRGPMAGRDQ